MTQLTEAEIAPGLAVFLDVAVLVACPECRSNARSRANLANRPGPFLVVAPVAEGTWLCVPLLSTAGRNRLTLDQALKSGPGMGWIGRSSHYSRHQFWIIPTDCLIQASSDELSPRGNRQRYAANAPAALATIAAGRNDSDAPYRRMPDLR